tara:strand:+ start:1283 stop:1855 length:573 start_codon:yes stop_codon:yes gene_type:complete
MDMTKLYTLILFVFSGSIFQLNAQEYKLSEAQSVNVVGTSTLHDWKVTVPKAEGFPISIDINSPLPEFTFKAEVKTMDGGRGASMNTKIYKALKSVEHPEIVYHQTEVSPVEKDGNEIIIISKGTLSIAGVENKVNLKIQGNLDGDQLVLNGKCLLKMTDYNIDPPSAMFGQIETDDEIEVVFEINYLKK